MIDKVVARQGEAMTPELRHELNGWRELGEEMGRVISSLTQEEYESAFPDWFGSRLFDLQVKAKQNAALDRCILCGDPRSKHTKSEADWRTVPGCTGHYL